MTWLNEQMKRKHEELEVGKCDDCADRYLCVLWLNVHMKRKHEELECGMKSELAAIMETYIKRKHEEL